MKTLVTGAAGFIGSNVVKGLLERGREVRALIYPGEDASNLEGLEVERIEGDIRDRGAMERAVKGCGAVYHLAAIYSIWLPDPGRMFEVNLSGSRNVLWACMKEGVGKVVFTSSIAAVGVRPDKEPADERTPFNQWRTGNDYVITKHLSEREALAFAAEGLPLVCVNPAFPLGPGDVAPTPTGKLIEDVIEGRLPVYLEGGFNIVDVEDVALGHILAEERGKVGERYILANTNIEFRQFVERAKAAAGVKGPLLKAPKSVMRAAGYALEYVADRFTRQTPLMTGKSVAYLAQHVYLDNAKARKELGLTFTPFEETLGKAVAWFKSRRETA